MSLGRPRRKWEDIIKIDLKGSGCEVVDYVHLETDKIINLRVPYKTGNFLNNLANISFLKEVCCMNINAVYICLRMYITDWNVSRSQYNQATAFL
jgi:hypothetical protein